MNDIHNDVEEDSNNVIITDGEANTSNRQNKQSVSDEFNSESNRTKNVNQQQLAQPTNNISNAISTFHLKNLRFMEAFVEERHTSLITDMTEHFDPVVEYAKEPLLSLTEACAPLNNIILNLFTYVQLALDETPQDPPDGLTFDESAAIRLYTIEWEEPHASLYSMLNSTLKKSSRDALRPYFKYLKLLLTALVKLPCAPLQTVWRGVTKDMSHGFPIGTQVTWWPFSSCTTSLTVLENNIYLGNAGERTLFSVEAINGRIIRAHSHFDDENEILLLPGTYMEVQSQLSPAPGLHIIHLKQIKPMEMLLEPPFEGALLYAPEEIKVPWYKNKRTIGELSLLICLCIAGIIVGAVLASRRSPPPPICRTRTTGINADLFWSFDCGDAREDLKGLDNGTDVNGASYSSPDFSGQGKALDLNRNLNQYVRLPRSLNLAVNTSFTVGVWVLLTASNWITILSDCNAFNSVCIGFIIRSINIYAVIFNWTDGNLIEQVIYDADGLLCQSCWMHLAFSYNNKTDNLSIYFDGLLMKEDKFMLNNISKLGTNGNKMSYIGQNSVVTHNDPFDGLIDQLSISYHVKNASEILDEATLLCDYNFETDDINLDAGPNNIEADSENVYRHLSNNLVFNSSDSFFQLSDFTLLMSIFYEFSIAFWLRPLIMGSDKVNGAAAILQLAWKVQQVSSDSYSCFLSFCIVNITNGTPYFRFNYEQLNRFNTLDTHVVENNTWIHIGISYMEGSILSFYLDGIYRGYVSDPRFSLLLYNPRLAVTIGGDYFDDTITTKPMNYESRKCFTENPDFNYTQMYGEIDDFKVYARALTDSEFLVLGGSKNRTTS